MKKETLEKNYPCSAKEIRDEAYQQGRADAIEDVGFAFKNYQNMNNPKNAHIFWEMLEQMQKGTENEQDNKK